MMQKIILVSSLLTTSLLSDTSLGHKISGGIAQEEIIQGNGTQMQSRVQQPLQTRVSPQNVEQNFRKDHHRYDKRYRDFNYNRDGYYNDEGLYFGYYDRTGYFYNNIFFAYNCNYTYSDRRYRRGFFRRGHHHRRPYVHHRFNDWNRIHCYREPNVIVRGHYYDRRYYPRSSRPSVVHNHHYHRPSNYGYRNSHGSHHYRPHRTPSRMHVTRMGNHSNHHTNNNCNYTNRNFNHNHRNSMHQPRSGYSRMHTPNSGHQHKSNRHMGISK